MSDWFEFLLFIIKQLKNNHPIKTSLIIVVLSIYALYKIWNHVMIPTGLMRLTQKNKIIDIFTVFIFLYILIMIINCLAMLGANKRYSVKEAVIEIKGIVKCSKKTSIEDGRYIEIEENIQKTKSEDVVLLTNATIALFISIGLIDVLAGYLKWIHMAEINNLFTTFSMFFHVLLFFLIMCFGGIFIIISGVCVDNIVIFLSILSIAQSIMITRFLSSLSLGYADYKMLNSYYRDEIITNNREWVYLYSLSDDMQFLECGSKLSKINNSVINIYSLQKISENGMKIQPTYAHEFRWYFSKIEWEINKLLSNSEMREIQITNPLNTVLKYVLLEIRYHRYPKKTTIYYVTRGLISEYDKGCEKDYCEIENWHPHECRNISLREEKNNYSYITMAMIDCETE